MMKSSITVRIAPRLDTKALEDSLRAAADNLRAARVPTTTPSSLQRLLAMALPADPDDPHLRLANCARALCEAAFGDWGATGFEIRMALIDAAEAALAELDRHGYDLTRLNTKRPA